jgi:hypothetical protein
MKGRNVGGIVALLICMAANSGVSDEAEISVEYRFVAIGFKQHHVLDPEHGRFRSSQDVLIRNTSGTAADSVAFNSHPSLAIVKVTVSEANGTEIGVGKPQVRGEVSVFRDYVFDVIEVELGTAVAPDETVNLHIEYELKADGALDAPRDMYEFTISPQACYSVYIGCNPLFGSASGAPYEMTVRYPDDYVLCVPGELVTSTIVDGDRVDTYRSAAPLQPSFSCARYRKIVKADEKVTLEYFLYRQEEFDDEMAQITFDILSLYTRYFGSRGANVYRYATVGPVNAPYPSGENKGATNFVTDFAAREFDADSPDGLLSYFRLMSHELYHKWNLGDVTWADVRLFEWFGEGGANFVSAWAAERIVGLDAGATIRRRYSEGVVRSECQKLEVTLENVTKTGGDDHLLYNYGALVWEQLRQKLGDEAFWAGLTDFYAKHAGRQVLFEDLIACLQARTAADVAAYLEQFTRHNARIDLSIATVKTLAEADRWTSTIEILVDADGDYELTTAIGVRDQDGEMETTPIRLTGRGSQTFVVTSSAPPEAIIVDPYFRLPQTNLENDVWSLPPSSE